MKAIVVLFDSLNRAYLPPYGDTSVIAPNFQRLANRSLTFDTCYVGSLPCMPARRELHTGRYNFLHRSWGPLEPFDDSMPELLSAAGIYTHLITDHAHYWEDGGCTYHTRYNSWESVRGQQGDQWKGQVEEPDIPSPYKIPMKPDGKSVASVWRYDWVNRQYFSEETDYPQNKTFNLAVEFLEKNCATDNWMLHIETFDPHEPFIVPERFKALYPEIRKDINFDWPRGICNDDASVIDHVRGLYKARVSMCDENLGKILDFMDGENLWEDTMLIVMSDHGFLLGEHDYWGKNGVAMYEEISHTPLFVWDPRCRLEAGRRSSLVQTIDLPPTLLEFFNQPIPLHMQGKSLRDTIASDTPARKTALFGYFGESVNITDGRFIYMRNPVRPENTPLNLYTLEPHHMYSRFSVDLLRKANLVRPGWGFLKECPVLQVPGKSRNAIETDKHRLFDITQTPLQDDVLEDDDRCREMETRLIEMLAESEAPSEQFERLGLRPELL